MRYISTSALTNLHCVKHNCYKPFKHFPCEDHRRHFSRQRWEDEIEENISNRAQKQGGGNGIVETAAGAVLGGLLGGPFGTQTTTN
jgi:hypothetical protein